MAAKWEPLLATEFLDFKNTGNRNHYQDINFDRRKRLEALVLAELLTEKGKYLNEVANGLWLLMEESTWSWPAHMKWQKTGNGLPDPNEFGVDLGVGETSANVAWIKFLLAENLSKLSPVFVKRIDYELNRRIIKPYIKQAKGWMGFGGHKTTNWNPWINSNVLLISLLTLNNQKEKKEIINKMAKSTDHWVNWYGDDGGCDEGPGYWNAAGGYFIQILYYLSSASGHQLDWSHNKLIDNIGSYIYKMHIDRDYFVNFADAAAKQIANPTLVHLFGQMYNNSKMIEFANYLYELSGSEQYLIDVVYSGNLHSYYLQLKSYFNFKDKIEAKAPQPIESWLPDLQVITLRTNEGSPKGLFLGAKAGNNGEDHNHNDIGNFVLYVDGKPAIIDIGTASYTAKTFSPQRYEIWSMQSQWHNTPTINGVQQHEGLSFTANNVSYTKMDNQNIFSGDIAAAYPKDAHIHSWVRKFTFDRSGNAIDLSETYHLNKFVEPIQIHFITVLNITNDPNKGEVILSNKVTNLVINYKTDQFAVKLDEHKTEDRKLLHIWGQVIHRLTFVGKHKELMGKHSFTFHSGHK